MSGVKGYDSAMAEKKTRIMMTSIESRSDNPNESDEKFRLDNSSILKED